MNKTSRTVATIFKESFLRKGPFEAIPQLGFPDFCHSLGIIDQTHALEFCRALYFQTIANVFGYSSMTRRTSLKDAKKHALDHRVGPHPYQVVGDPFSRSFNKPCGDVTRALQKASFERGVWRRKRGGIFETVTRSGTLGCRFDFGTYRGWLDLELLFPDIRFRIPVGLFFWIDLHQALTYQEPNVFEESLKKVLDLVGILKLRMDAIPLKSIDAETNAGS